MKYKFLLFDMDDTLLDFRSNETDSLNKLFNYYGYEFTEEVFRIYNSVNKQLWSDYEAGVISLEDIMKTRFSKTLALLGKTADGGEWENRYRELLGSGTQLIDGAPDICRNLAASRRSFIITNGVTYTQIHRLKSSGLYDYFENVFTSQMIGFQKPSMGFFRYVMTHIDGFNKESCLIIGDSLTTDIKGGLLSGIDTCWFNINSMNSPSDIKSTFTIADLSELYKICSE